MTLGAKGSNSCQVILSLTNTVNLYRYACVYKFKIEWVACLPRTKDLWVPVLRKGPFQHQFKLSVNLFNEPPHLSSWDIYYGSQPANFVLPWPREKDSQQKIIKTAQRNSDKLPSLYHICICSKVTRDDQNQQLFMSANNFSQHEFICCFIPPKLKQVNT